MARNCRRKMGNRSALSLHVLWVRFTRLHRLGVSDRNADLLLTS